MGHMGIQFHVQHSFLPVQITDLGHTSLHWEELGLFSPIFCWPVLASPQGLAGEGASFISFDINVECMEAVFLAELGSVSNSLTACAVGRDSNSR